MRSMIQKFDIKEHKGGQNGCPSCLSPFLRLKPVVEAYCLKGRHKKMTLPRLFIFCLFENPLYYCISKIVKSWHIYCYQKSK